MLLYAYHIVSQAAAAAAGRRLLMIQLMVSLPRHKALSGKYFIIRARPRCLMTLLLGDGPGSPALLVAGRGGGSGV